MKNTEISYINDKHQQIVELHLRKIKKAMYFATEDVGEGKYQDFLEIMNSVYLYSNNFYENIKIKEIRIKIRKRLATAGATLGFATVLNTSTIPMGFTGGSTVTYTDLVEEEL